jgi:pyridoxal phosphate-dependent aminotransferase EpsN
MAQKLPKAVIVVNLYGQSSDMGPIRDLCRRYGVPVVEDAAESLGATYKGKASGTFGEFGIFSFNGNKIITTSGGGMLVSDNQEALDKARYWATQARDPARHYQHSETGYNYRMSNVLAAIGRGQFKVLNERIRARRNVFDFYYKMLAEIEGVAFMPEASFGQSTRWLTALTIDPNRAGVSAADIVDFLATHNIEARPVWKPLHLQPLFRDCFYYPHTETSSVSDKLFEDGLCLPSGSQMTENDQIRVTDLIAQSLKKAVKL